MAYGPFNAGGGVSGGGSNKIIGTGAPTTSTVGAVGQDYLDRSTGTTYTCVAVSGSTYTWEISGTRDASKIEIGTGAEKKKLDAAIEQIKSDVGGAKPMSGTTDPTQSTKGAVGQTYTNTATGKVWTCIAANDTTGVYTWETSGGRDVELKTNKVNSLSASSTNDQYPSAKCVYDLVGNVEAALAALR